jgi:DTW domain-containing protein
MRCQTCHSTLARCYCADIPKVLTQTHFIFWQHILEVPKTSNTGRAAALALVNSTLFLYGKKGEIPAPIPEDTFILFPGSGDRDVHGPVQNVLVLDASWSQARRMLQRIPQLQRMKRISLVLPAVRAPSLRDAPTFGCSTLEAVALYVSTYESATAAGSLNQLHQRLVDRNMQARGYV